MADREPTMSTLKPWRQVATPHADIRSGKFDASVFAADLGEVLAGRGAIDYRDAETFFSKTYLTHGLTQLLIDVMRRLVGAGKMHTLLTVYHLLTKPNEVGKLPEIQQIVSTAGLKCIPTVNVACLVGT